MRTLVVIPTYNEAESIGALTGRPRFGWIWVWPRSRRHAANAAVIAATHAAPRTSPASTSDT